MINEEYIVDYNIHILKIKDIFNSINEININKNLDILYKYIKIFEYDIIVYNELLNYIYFNLNNYNFNFDIYNTIINFLINKFEMYKKFNILKLVNLVNNNKITYDILNDINKSLNDVDLIEFKKELLVIKITSLLCLDYDKNKNEILQCENKILNLINGDNNDNNMDG